MQISSVNPGRRELRAAHSGNLPVYQLQGWMKLNSSSESFKQSRVLPWIARAPLWDLVFKKTSTISLQQKEAFKVRWFCLDSQERKLMYFKNPLVRRVFFAIPQAPSWGWVGRKGLFSSSSSSCCPRLKQGQSQEVISVVSGSLRTWAVWELWPLKWLWERSKSFKSSCYYL